jgi:hypothetical protein
MLTPSPDPPKVNHGLGEGDLNALTLVPLMGAPDDDVAAEG